MGKARQSKKSGKAKGTPTKQGKRDSGGRTGSRAGATAGERTAGIVLRKMFYLFLEASGLLLISFGVIILFLGHFGHRFSGTDLMGSLIPFGTGILILVLVGVLLLNGWQKLRPVLKRQSPAMPAVLVTAITVILAVMLPKGDLLQAYGYYRTLVGGKEEAKIITLRHQVYAAYRRLGAVQVEKMIERSQPYQADIEKAAEAYDLDPDLLKGLAATESSYLPRKSKDGGHGLFQITQAPKQVEKDVNGRFPQEEQTQANSRYNAFLGAATLAHYLKDMNDDLFLGLLAYNIGPANGGLRFIMEQYGARDFVTIQPYLHKLPRDYPIRVLAYGLAFMVERRLGKVLAYEEDDNARTIQALSIPGLE